MAFKQFEIQGAPPLKGFIFISLCLHIAVMVVQGLMPDEKTDRKKFPPIKVSYLKQEEKKVPQKPPTFVDAPKPRKVETPKTSELIARYDSRAHSNQKSRKRLLYKSNKTLVPKIKKSAPVKKQSHAVTKKKKASEPQTSQLKKPYHPGDKGFALPKTRGEVTREAVPEKRPGGTLALLDGFDPGKYPKIDTQTETDEGDDEPISLDTKESKYASYFARIKRQIEQVWTYPDEAARKGISGRLTLRFQISKDGHLMNVWLINESGYLVLDEAALQAVKTAAPYYPFPVTIDRESLSILATFIYSPSYSSQYFKRR